MRTKTIIVPIFVEDGHSYGNGNLPNAYFVFGGLALLAIFCFYVRKIMRER
jgi:hypothetical protein